MDAISAINENKNELQEIISGRREEIDGRTVEGIMRREPFSIERLEAETMENRMSFQQELVMVGSRLKRARYQRELSELEGKKDTAEGMAAYCEKRIQMEQNDMERRLLMASVLGRRIAADRIRAESLEGITTWRRELIKYYEELSDKGASGQDRIERNREIQVTELEKEEAIYKEAVAVLNPRVLIAATLDKVKTKRDEEERRERERKEGEETEEGNVSELVQEFLNADFSEQTLEAGYVIKNLYRCLHNVELIRRVGGMAFAGDDAAKITRKLEAVREYENVVESALWDYGLTVDFHTLEIREIREGDEVFVRKRQRYLANGALRFWFAMKRYNQSQNGGTASADAPRQEAELTRVEEKLSALEAELRMQRDEGTRITRTLTRHVGKRDSAQTGDTIRADAKYYKGKMEHLQIKVRLWMIYHRMKWKLEREFEGGSMAFASLE